MNEQLVEQKKTDVVRYFDHIVANMSNEDVEALASELSDYFNVYSEGMRDSIEAAHGED